MRSLKPLTESPKDTVNLSPALVEAVQTERAKRRLHPFIKQAWHVLEPETVFQDNWHIGAVCEHLEAVTSGQIRRLIINQPPGTMKSLSVCVFWFCWSWIKFPALRWLYTSYSESFALRDATKSLTLIKSSWYQSRFGNDFALLTDGAGKFTNDKTGFRLSTSIGGAGTGERADIMVGDDCLKIEEGHSKAARDGVNRHWDLTISGRATDPRTGRFVVVGQRLDEEDLSGHLQKQGGYVLLSLPMEYEPHRKCITPIWRDPRTEEGQLLWEERFTKLEVDDWKKRLSAYGTAGQLQQNPEPEGKGGIFNRADFRAFTVEVTQEPAPGEGTFECRWLILDHGEGRKDRVRARDCKWFQTVDTAMKTGQDNDYTVVGTWALTPLGMLCLYHILRCKIAIPYQYQYVLDARKQALFPVVFQAIEDKVSGTGIIQEGVVRGTPFKTLKADQNPRLRVSDIATRYANHMVFHLAGADWLTDYEHELAIFDRGAHDDQVMVACYAGQLATSDALLRLDLDHNPVLWPRPGDLSAERNILNNEIRVTVRDQEFVFYDDDDDLVDVWRRR